MAYGPLEAFGLLVGVQGVALAATAVFPWPTEQPKPKRKPSPVEAKPEPRPSGSRRRLAEKQRERQERDAAAGMPYEPQQQYGASQNRVIGPREALKEWFRDCISIPMSSIPEERIDIHAAAESYARYCGHHQYPTYDLTGFVGGLAELAKEYHFSMGKNCDILGVRLNR